MLVAYVLVFASFFNITPERWAILVLTISAVIGSEMVNTSIEVFCNMYTKENHPLVKIIKDVAAGAVLISAICAVAVAFVLFWTPADLWRLLVFVCGNPLILTLFILTVVMSVLFIVFGTEVFAKNKEERNKTHEE
ncbi:hypothetical protein AGMMS50284_0870 [Clostridia bacterium]|nr:hypothetical protein AGMMS50284_0870 [Clostridia bacterium]